MQKATPVPPPATDEEFIDVDMTRVYTMLGVLGVTTTALTASTVYLWRKVRHTEQNQEALAEFTSRMVNDTECGRTAYATLIHGAVLEETADWSEEEDVQETFTSDDMRRLYTGDLVTDLEE